MAVNPASVVGCVDACESINFKHPSSHVFEEDIPNQGLLAHPRGLESEKYITVSWAWRN